MRKVNYNQFPTTKISGSVIQGWEDIRTLLSVCLEKKSILTIDFYTGVYEDEILHALTPIPHTTWINTRNLMKSEKEIQKMTERFMTEDALFGYITNLTLDDYFNIEKVKEAQLQVKNSTGNCIIIGIGASCLVPSDATRIYIDMSRREIQQRFQRHEVKALGIDNSKDTVSIQYKRGYFNDWKICDKYKEGLFYEIDFWIDTHIANNPKMIDKVTFLEGIDKTIKSPFRVVPFFDPAPWGGQWMKEICGLDPKKENYGWCFDCVPEENSLLFEINGVRFEIPSINLVLLKSRELLGERVEARFGKDFPIRFDFLDTVHGGNLSVQVHPTTQFIRENFGMCYTQDESYYLLDAKEGASVYLGLKEAIDKEEMITDLIKAQEENIVFDTEKYVNKIAVKKHDHYLIPGGTVHCSGTEALVLEISSTPNLFTFKLWDWQRLGLDGNPRTINIERGKKVIDWTRDTQYVKEQLCNQITEMDSGDGWREERTGLHPNEFIETRRHWFTKPVSHHTNHSVNVLNLVQGEEAIITSPSESFPPFIVHYAETFILPACIGSYTISPHGLSVGQECATIKAYIRF